MVIHRAVGSTADNDRPHTDQQTRTRSLSCAESQNLPLIRVIVEQILTPMRYLLTSLQRLCTMRRLTKEDVLKKYLFLSLLLVLFAVSAQAKRIDAFYDDAPPEACGAISADRACYYPVANYSSCQALAANGELCQQIINDPVTRWLRCASVAWSAYCQCNERTKVQSGTCVFTK